MSPHFFVLLFLGVLSFALAGVVYKHTPPPPPSPVYYLVSYVGQKKDGGTFTGRVVRYWTRINDIGKMVEETEASLIESNKEQDCVKIIITGMDKLEKYP